MNVQLVPTTVTKAVLTRRSHISVLVMTPHVAAAVFQCVQNTVVPVCLSSSVVCKRTSIVPERLESCFITEATSLRMNAAQ